MIQDNGSNKNTRVAKARFFTLAFSIIAGICLFFSINILAEIFKEPFQNLNRNIDMSSPINISILLVIPFVFIGTLLVSIIAFWFLNKEKYLSFSLGSSIVGFCIDTYIKTGGIIGMLLLLDDSPGYLLFVISAFLIIYGIAFITMYYSLKTLTFILKRG